MNKGKWKQWRKQKENLNKSNVAITPEGPRGSKTYSQLAYICP